MKFSYLIKKGIRLKKYDIAIVGATGLVGREMLKIIEERKFPVSSLHLFASEKSTNTKISFQENIIPVKTLNNQSFNGIQYALFSAGTAVSRDFAPIANKSNCMVIDNSKTFRMEKSVPLVVPEINAFLLADKPKLIANPNCSTIQMVVALKPIYEHFGISRIVVSTYQAVAGTGKKAVAELRQQSESVLQNLLIKRSVYPHQIAFNCLPQIDDFCENDYTLEEMKLVNETRKIFADDSLQIYATAVRVPVFIGHSESVYVECKKDISIEKIKKLLQETKGVKLIDNPSRNEYPMQIDTEFEDNVLVGRVRADLSNPKSFGMWIVANNLRKGAALNAVQILEACVSI